MPVTCTSRTATKLESRSQNQPPTPIATSTREREPVAQRAAVDHRHHCRRCFNARSDGVDLLESEARRSADHAVDVARAHRQQQVALAQFGAQEPLGGRVVAHPGDALAVAGVGGGLGHEQAGDAGVVLGGLARGIDVQDHREVGVARAPAPNAVASRCVRLYRCGWNSATTRRGFWVRAAAIVAATSVGWCA